MRTMLIRRWLSSVPLMVAALVTIPTSARAQVDDSVEVGKTIAFEYTILDEEGTIIDSNVGSDPAGYVPGQTGVPASLEDAFSDMGVGDRRSVILLPAETQGPADPNAFAEVPKEQVPEEARQVGTRLAVVGVDWPVLVHEVRPDTIVLDLNHPLAGKTLTFVVRIISIG